MVSLAWPFDQAVKRYPQSRWLAPANRDDNFQFVTIGQQMLIELSARHDFTITFQRDTLAAQLHLFEQRGDADGAIEMARFAID